MSKDTHIVGKSRHAELLRRRLAQLSKNRDDCLIIGEPGTGKTLFATEIGSFDTQFRTITANAVTEQELEDLLALVRGGTLLLESPEAGSFRQQKVVADFVGSRSGDVRVLVTLRESPERLLTEHRLIEELYAKLLQFEAVEILPLQERPEDIPVLVRHFAPALVIDINGLEALVRHLWRENVSELRRVIERSVASSDDGTVTLPAELVEQSTEIARVVNGILSGPGQHFDSSLDILEKGIIERALERFGFDSSSVAKFLNISDETLQEKLRRFGLSALKSRA